MWVGMKRRTATHLLADIGPAAFRREFVAAHPFAPGRGSLAGRVASERRAIRIADALQDPEYNHEAQKILGFRSVLGVPLQRVAPDI